MLNDAGISSRTASCIAPAPNTWMVVHGAGAGHETLTSAVVGRNAAMVVDEDLHDFVAAGARGGRIPGHTRARDSRSESISIHMPGAAVRSPGVVLGAPATRVSAAMRFSARARMPG